MAKDKNEILVFGEGFERCPQTGRPFERGSGALSKAEQTKMYLREAALMGTPVVEPNK